jgi:flagellum-specific peptidoglycan hydrolase FlgJ
MSNTDFINEAIVPAQASQEQIGVPAAVTIAQAILESGWGQHHLGEANNYFGIKAFKRNGTIDFGSIAVGFVTVPTREVINGAEVMV